MSSLSSGFQGARLIVGLFFFIGACIRGGAEGFDGGASCPEQIRRLHGALWEYRRIYGAFPDRLEQLVPRYVADEDSLKCPNTSIGLGGRGGDSSLGVYEYQVEGIPRSQSQATPDAKAVMQRRDFLSRHSMSSDMFSIWPLIRCHFEHGRLTASGEALNIDVRGEFFLSPSLWEERLEHEVELSRYLTLDLENGVISDRLHEFQSQGLALGSESINISEHCNIIRRGSWFRGSVQAFLGSLMKSTLPERGQFLSFSKVPYFIANIVQLDPEPNNFHRNSVIGIPVRRRATAIHVLVGGFFRSAGVDDGWGISVKDVSAIGLEAAESNMEIIIHFEDSMTRPQVKRIRRGVDFNCFFEISETEGWPVDGPDPAWSSGINWSEDFDGVFADEWQDREISDSLFTVSLLNEFPERVVHSIDLVAPPAPDSRNVVKPFVVGITIE